MTDCKFCHGKGVSDISDPCICKCSADIERLSNLCDKWNSECDEYREENKRQAERIRALEAHNAVLFELLSKWATASGGFTETYYATKKAIASTPEQSLSFIRRAERERCARLADNTHPDDWAFVGAAIRQMED